MNDFSPLEAQLREALREVPAPALLRSRILNAAAAQSRSTPRATVWRRWVAMAALLTLGSFGLYRWEQQRRAQAAAEQFTLALQIAQRKVQHVQAKLVVEVPVSLTRQN